MTYLKCIAASVGPVLSILTWEVGTRHSWWTKQRSLSGKKGPTKTSKIKEPLHSEDNYEREVWNGNNCCLPILRWGLGGFICPIDSPFSPFIIGKSSYLLSVVYPRATLSITFKWNEIKISTIGWLKNSFLYESQASVHRGDQLTETIKIPAEISKWMSIHQLCLAPKMIGET